MLTAAEELKFIIEIVRKVLYAYPSKVIVRDSEPL